MGFPKRFPVRGSLFFFVFVFCLISRIIRNVDTIKKKELYDLACGGQDGNMNFKPPRFLVFRFRFDFNLNSSPVLDVGCGIWDIFLLLFLYTKIAIFAPPPRRTVGRRLEQGARPVGASRAQLKARQRKQVRSPRERAVRQKQSRWLVVAVAPTSTP